MYLNPASLAVFTHCSQSSLSGLKDAAGSVPSDHSFSLKVFTPKWTNMPYPLAICCFCNVLGDEEGSICAVAVKESSWKKQEKKTTILGIYMFIVSMIGQENGTIEINIQIFLYNYGYMLMSNNKM